MDKKILRYDQWLAESQVADLGMAGAGGDQSHAEEIPGAKDEIPGTESEADKLPGVDLDADGNPIPSVDPPQAKAEDKEPADEMKGKKPENTEE